MIDLKYPIGKYEQLPFSEKQKENWIADISFLPHELEVAILNLDEQQLNTPYREGGWTLKQVVHHVCDSHINSYTRFKLAITEDEPTIKPYLENEWAKLADVEIVPVNVSLTILHGVHTRLSVFLKSVENNQLQRIVIHPEDNKEMSVWYLLGLYAWHGKHHTAHITSLRNRMNW